MVAPYGSEDYERRRNYFLKRKAEAELVGDLEAARRFNAAATQPFCFYLPKELKESEK